MIIYRYKATDTLYLFCRIYYDKGVKLAIICELGKYASIPFEHLVIDSQWAEVYRYGNL